MLWYDTFNIRNENIPAVILRNELRKSDSLIIFSVFSCTPANHSQPLIVFVQSLTVRNNIGSFYELQDWGGRSWLLSPWRRALPAGPCEVWDPGLYLFQARTPFLKSWIKKRSRSQPCQWIECWLALLTRIKNSQDVVKILLSLNDALRPLRVAQSCQQWHGLGGSGQHCPAKPIGGNCLLEK